METRFAYLAEDKLYLKDGQDPPRLVESQFAQNAIDRSSRDNQRNAWKRSTLTEGFARQMVWNSRDADLGARVVQTTGLAVTGDELFYAMNIDSMGGLFTQGARDPSERRLLHRQNLHVRDLCRHPDGTLLLSLQMNDGTANIATLDQGGRGVREVTEGDSIDRAPSWVPGREGQIIFQSAGVGRNTHGLIAGVGPFSIQQLDLRSGEMTALVEDDRSDLLMPKQAADGSLYYIRRPYETGAVRHHPLKVLGDVVLFPYRLIRMFIAFGQWMSIMFAGKPLITAGAPTRDRTDQQRHLMLFGKLIDAEKALKAAKEGEAVSLVPDSWELIRRSLNGQETVLVSGVLAYDLYSDGSILYTNGSAIFHQAPGDSAKRLHEGKLIEHVVAIGAGGAKLLARMIHHGALEYCREGTRTQGLKFQVDASI